ncbi:3-hydroxyacyl-CoA dehydrogenase NAD-binding domain-containing protein [Novosphingobium resinovorum]|nr:3-hydroxyacyl-CoA dehydrogenase NAD-binding domain-containing protein [Novosphingobium resinovorum]
MEKVLDHLTTTLVQGGVAVITLDNPPVNALSAPLRRNLLAALEGGMADETVQAVVLICAGRTFIAGADITEFGKPPQSPGFAEVFDAIENAAKPVVAAIHGQALGGGFELALVCHYRIAAQTARVGLPEVHLGILPGAGGTQRLPRVTGAEAAMDIIASGRLIGSAEAQALGLVDQVVPDAELLDRALSFARQVVADGAQRPRIRDREDRIAEARAKEGLFAAFRQTNARRFHGFKAPDAIVEAVEAAVTLPFEEGLAREQALFEHLVATTESAAQRHAFFAERGTAQVPDIPRDTGTIDVASVGIVGAGTMGGGIAMNFLSAGIPVTLVEMKQEALDRGVAAIRRNYKASVRKGRMTAEQVEDHMALLSPSLDYESLRGADLVIEAVFESMAVKKDVFARLDGATKPEAILASNTSFLDLDEIAQATTRPERVIGLHFFSPANVMRLLEVVRGEATSKPLVATAMKLAKRIGKVPVLSRVCPGFIANRLLAPRGEQAELLALEGTPIADIDKVLRDYGFAMGHFQMMDLVGLDVIGRDAAERTVMGDLVAMGRLGQKQNGGYYDYDEQRKPRMSQVATDVVVNVASAKGIVQSPTTDPDTLLEALLFPVVNEGAKILEEQVALRAADIDIAAILGYNWPVYTGGPMFWANTIGLDRVVAGLERLESLHGAAFRPSRLLLRLAAESSTF